MAEEVSWRGWRQVLRLQGKPGVRLNDGMSSIANGMFLTFKDILIKGLLVPISQNKFCVTDTPESIYSLV